MHRITGLVSRFGRHEGGAFAVIFAVMAIVMIAFGGAVVDYVAMEQTRSRAQTSLDAAALALQPEIFNTATTKEAIRVKAEKLLLGGIAGEWGVTARIPTSGIVINTVDGSLLLRAEMTMPTIFVNLVGVSQLKAQVQSQATRKKLALEVVMVLDNSGSMLTTSKNPTTGVQESRMAKLKEAATCAANTIFYDKVNNNANCTPATGSKLLDNVKMGVVPFTMYVNVGAGNASQAWIDKTGASPTSNDNFDNDGSVATAFTGAVNRLALYDDVTNDDWRGCVEARPHIASGGGDRYYDTDDTTPVAGTPATLFVPLFAPDVSELTYSINSYNNYTDDSPAQCDRPSGSTVRCTYTEVKKTCSSYASCSGATTNTYAFTGPTNFAVNARYYVGGYPPSCDCRAGWTTDTGTSSYTGTGSNRTYTRTRTCNTTYKPTGLTDRELQERMCKYQGAIGYTTAQKGPNADCPYQALTPLTQTPATVQSTITNMVADGGTNIHEGTAWGYRVLSPSVPFTQGGVYNEATSKVMIIMTDGENTAYQNSSINGSAYFSAYGFPYNSSNTNANSSSGGTVNRLGTGNTSNGSNNWTNAQLVNEMNVRTLQTCTNAKAQGITVYTIGLSVDASTQSTPAVVRDMLTKCASNSTFAFFPDQPSELRAVFQKIASQLTALRLAL